MKITKSQRDFEKQSDELRSIAKKCGIQDCDLEAAIQNFAHEYLKDQTLSPKAFFKDYAFYLSDSQRRQMLSRPVPRPPEEVADEVIERCLGNAPVRFGTLRSLHSAITQAMNVDRVQTLGMAKINCTYDAQTKSWVSHGPA